MSRLRQYNHFNPHDSNTICDVTGFKVKMSEVRERWEGFYVVDNAWNPRQPQDFPVVPEKQRTIPNSRQEDLTTDDVQTFEVI